MKILHTADWHLGKRLDRFDRQKEQWAVLDEICEISDSQDVDAIVIAGDLYGYYNPPIEASENFYQALKRLSKDGQRAVVAIAGNHDSPDRIEAPDPLARECGIIVAGYPHSKIRPFRLETGLEVLRSDEGFIELKLPRQSVPLRIILTPYANEVRMRKAIGHERPEAQLRELLQSHWARLAETYCDDKGVNMMVSHLFMILHGTEPPEEPEDEKPINVGGAQVIFTQNLPAQIQYCALGHLHRYQEMGGGPCPVVYSSSPLEYSFAEAGQDKYVVIIEMEAGQQAIHHKVKLKSGMDLCRMRFEAVDEAISWLQNNPETFVELTIVSDSYLNSSDRQRLMKAHSRIIGPIPEIRNPDLLQGNQQKAIDLSRSREEIFIDYFKYVKDQSPNEELMVLFREIVGMEGEE